MLTVFEVQEPIVWITAQRKWALLADLMDEEVSIEDIQDGFFEDYTCHMERGEYIVYRPSDCPWTENEAEFAFFTGESWWQSDNTLYEEAIFHEAPLTEDNFMEILPGLAIFEQFSTRPKLPKFVAKEI